MKYIIELEPFTFDEDTFPVLWQAQGFRTLFFDNYGVGKLTPLSVDSCIEHLHKSGWMKDHDKVIYEQGYGDGLAKNASDTEETQVNKELEAYCYKHACSSYFMKTKFPKCGNGQNVMYFKGNELEAALKLMQADELLHQQKEKS